MSKKKNLRDDEITKEFNIEVDEPKSLEDQLAEAKQELAMIRSSYIADEIRMHRVMKNASEVLRQIYSRRPHERYRMNGETVSAMRMADMLDEVAKAIIANEDY